MKRTGLLLMLAVWIVQPTLGLSQSDFSGAYIGKFTTQERPIEAGAEETEQQMRLYNRILLGYEPSENFAVRTAFRRADFFQEETGSTHLYYAYLNWQPFAALETQIGRQYPFNKMVRRAVDGLSLEWSPLTHWTIQGLWGVFAPADRAGFTDVPEDEHGYYMALEYHGSDNTSLAVSGYQQVSQGRIMNFAGFEGRYPDLLGINMHAFVKYNFTENLLQEAEGQIRREFGENFSITAAANYRDPNFDLPPWYWQFTVDPYSTYRVAADYFVTETGSFNAEYFTRVMGDESVERIRFGWMEPTWIVGFVHAYDSRGDSEEWNLYGSLQHRFGQKLLVGVGANYFDYVFQEQYEEPLNAFGAQGYLKYRLWNALTLGVRGYYLTNPRFAEEVRFIGEFSYRF